MRLAAIVNFLKVICWLWLSKSEVAPVRDRASPNKNEPFEFVPKLFLTKLRLLLPSLLLSLLQEVFFRLPNRLFLFWLFCCDRGSLAASGSILSTFVFYLLILPIDRCWELFSAASLSLMLRFAVAFWRRSFALKDWLTEVRDCWTLERWSLSIGGWEYWSGLAMFWLLYLSKDTNGFIYWFFANTELVLLWVSGFLDYCSDLVYCETCKSIVFPIAFLAIGDRDASTFSASSSAAFLGLSTFDFLLPLLSLLKSSSSGESRAPASRNINLFDIGWLSILWFPMDTFNGFWIYLLKLTSACSPCSLALFLYIVWS